VPCAEPTLANMTRAVTAKFQAATHIFSRVLVVVASSATKPVKDYLVFRINSSINTLRTGDADLRFYITTVQDG